MEDKTNRINEITRKLSELSLNISRVPSDTKKDFIGLANAKFAGDYGLTIKWLYDEANTYQYMKALFFDKMQNMEDKVDILIEKINSLQNKHEENTVEKPKRFGNRIEE